VPVELNAALRLQVPAQARVGGEVAVRLQAPAGLELKDGFVELTFDPAALAPVGFAAPVPGRVQIDSSTVASGAELRFKVLGDKAGTTQVAVSNIELVDASGFAVGMMAPPPAQIAIVK
jgi:general secretion pathway protein D